MSRDLILEEISRVGGVVDKTRKGRHRVIFWRVGEQKFVTTTAATPSDRRAVLNQVSLIRRQAAQAALGN